MAQTKNTFIKSKMNKDLDERLVPNGEYRDALNVEVSQSEDSDIGTLSTALGNVKLTDFGLTNNCEAKIIGFFADEKDKNIYVFITNFIDTSPNKLDLFPSDNAVCQIWRRNIETNLSTKLVEGKFLNFSLTHEILNINLLEDLLFWTDNRNQPRKINVSKANPSNDANPVYYKNEDQISVAKYYPFQPIELLDDYIVDYSVSSNGGGTSASPTVYYSLLNEIIPTTASTGSGVGLVVKVTSADSSTGNLIAVEIINQGVGYQNGDVINIAPRSGSAQITLVVELQSTMKDKCSEFLPETESVTTANGSGSWVGSIQSGVPFSPEPGSGSNPFVSFVGSLVKITNSAGQDITPIGAKLTGAVVTLGTLAMTVEWKNTPQTITTGIGTIIKAGLNPDYDSDWPGDCEFLKDKFVRFAYRFKFDDNEYSLISPFTQACFVPSQNGYFLSESREDIDGGTSQTITDAELAYESTDLQFFENLVNSIDLKIPAPNFLNSANNYFSNLTSEMHVKEIDIIYKDDNENVLKVLDTITKETFENVDYQYIVYDYQSRSPIKVLPEDEITRVSDKVPLRALAQEISGNRVIYGNYTDSHTSNQTLNYEIAAAEKVQITTPASGIINPNIKKEYQNHTLKQNRNYQVGIILSDRYGRQSDVILSSLDNSKTTVLGDSYRGSTIFHPFYSTDPGLIDGVTTWAGDSLKVQFNSVIPETTGQFGYPGLFKDYEPPTLSNLQSTGGYTGPGATGAATTGGSGTGLTVDYTTSKQSGTSYIVSVTINNPGVGYANGDVITISGSSGDPATFIYNTDVFPNLVGWYSYKIVVKQQEQDYYNVYLPGIVNGAINEDGIDSTTRATVSLFGDNINKVPKDLLDVGPSQTNYRSDTKLSLRVQNVNTTFNSSQQFYPGTNLENVVLLSELTDLGIDLTKTSSLTKTGGAAITPPSPVELQSPNENIQPGMSVIAIDSSGNPDIPLSQGAYVFSYYVDNTGKGQVEIKGTTTSIDPGSTLTFGPAGIIYNSNNNPIVGVLSTSKAIGVAEEDNFAVKLAVAETQPVKSLLDIYYETTTSGLIDSLNSAIIAGTPVSLPFGISPISFSLTEAQTGVVACTNTFQPLSGLNTDIVDPNTTGSLIRVVDNNGGNRTNEFSLTIDNNGRAVISTNKVAGSGFFVGNNSSITNFVFDVKLTNNGIDVFKSFQGVVENVRPSYVNPSPIPSSYTIGKFGGIIPDAYKAVNGSGDTSLNKNDLKWELVSVIPIAGENRPFDPDILAQDANGNFFPIGPDAANSWPTVILPAESNEDQDTNYQIVLQDNYIDFDFIRIINEDLSGQSDREINNDSIKLVVSNLNTANVDFQVDPDGDPNFFQQYSDLFGNNTNSDPFNVSINIIQAINYITWQVKLRVVDGGGQAGIVPGTTSNEIVLEITQQ
jgi:hypothetical protein